MSRTGQDDRRCSSTVTKRAAGLPHSHANAQCRLYYACSCLRPLPSQSPTGPRGRAACSVSALDANCVTVLPGVPVLVPSPLFGLLVNSLQQLLSQWTVRALVHPCCYISTLRATSHILPTVDGSPQQAPSARGDAGNRLSQLIWQATCSGQAGTWRSRRHADTDHRADTDRPSECRRSISNPDSSPALARVGL